MLRTEEGTPQDGGQGSDSQPCMQRPCGGYETGRVYLRKGIGGHRHCEHSWEKELLRKESGDAGSRPCYSKHGSWKNSEFTWFNLLL